MTIPIPADGRPPLPRISLPAVARLRTSLCEEAAYPCYGDHLVGDEYLLFVDRIAAFLAPRGVDPAVAAASCRVVHGVHLTNPALLEFAWRIAGNLGRLRAGTPLGPAQLPAAPEWIPLQVLASLLTATPKGTQGSEFSLRALAGTCCPLVVAKFWPRGVYTFVAGDLGFTPRWGAMPLQHAAQLVGLRFFGLVDPALARDGRPGFREVAATRSMLAHNRGILARRFRRGDACPFGYDGAAFIPCHRCAVGYAGGDGPGTCRAACHAAAYEAAACPGCGRGDAPFDPQVSTALCIECIVRRRTNPPS